MPQVDEPASPAWRWARTAALIFHRLQERRRFLPAGVILPMPGRPGAEALPGCPFDGGYDPFGCGEMDGTPRKRNSLTMTATGRRRMRPSPERTDSSTPAFATGGREFLTVFGPGSGSTTIRCPDVQ